MIPKWDRVRRIHLAGGELPAEPSDHLPVWVDLRVDFGREWLVRKG